MMARDQASTFAKGLAVLACFENGARDLTMADIAARTGFDRAVARRLCLTLEAGGYLARAGKFLRLTPKVLALTGGFLSAEGIGRTVQPMLNQFAEDLNGEIALAVRDGTRALYVARSAVSGARMSLGFTVGSSLPLLPTAVGHMLLASCPDSDRESILTACPLRAYTPATDLDIGSLRTRIAKAGANGFAYVHEEFESGAAGLAVPVKLPSPAQYVLATSASASVLAEDANRRRALEILQHAAYNLRSG